MTDSQDKKRRYLNVNTLNMASLLLLTVLIGWLLIVGRNLFIPFILTPPKFD